MGYTITIVLVNRHPTKEQRGMKTNGTTTQDLMAKLIDYRKLNVTLPVSLVQLSKAGRRGYQQVAMQNGRGCFTRHARIVDFVGERNAPVFRGTLPPIEDVTLAEYRAINDALREASKDQEEFMLRRGLWAEGKWGVATICYSTAA